MRNNGKIYLLMNSGIVQGMVKTDEEAKEWLTKELEAESHYKWTHGYPYTEELDLSDFKGTGYSIYEYFDVLTRAFMDYTPNDAEFKFANYPSKKFETLKKEDIVDLVLTAKEIILKGFLK